jgi:hypothetical protein
MVTQKRSANFWQNLHILNILHVRHLDHFSRDIFNTLINSMQKIP